MANIRLIAPFTYFGGKRKIIDEVWSAIGDVAHYLEPFFGSGAILLGRPDYDEKRHTETVNDKDGFVANVWRALAADPDGVAKYCDWPVNHADLMARKAELLRNEARLLEYLTADPEWFDAKQAGYWIWAACNWIGAGLKSIGQRPELGTRGKGVSSIGIASTATDRFNGVTPRNDNIYQWFRNLSVRLRRVRVVCGDWSRICGGNWQNKVGNVGIFFDPPYGVVDRNTELYHKESITVAQDVEKWALEHGGRQDYRIVIAGYDTEYASLISAGWTVKSWSSDGGYANTTREGADSRGKQNRSRERLFYSPHCLLDGQKPTVSQTEKKISFVNYYATLKGKKQ